MRLSIKKNRKGFESFNKFVLSPLKIDVELQQFDLYLLLNDQNIVNMKYLKTIEELKNM